MQSLPFRNDRFIGLIPTFVCNLSELEILDCRFNSIEGSIPQEIGRFGNLKILHIANNKLSGAIPNSISNLSSLLIFSLPYNFSSSNEFSLHYNSISFFPGDPCFISNERYNILYNFRLNIYVVCHLLFSIATENHTPLKNSTVQLNPKSMVN